MAEAVIRYRAERGLRQTALARLLGWRQPVVAWLEATEHNRNKAMVGSVPPSSMHSISSAVMSARPARSATLRPSARRWS